MPLTPLHFAIGAPSSDLTFDLVEAAVQAHVDEGQRLDFKRELPGQKGLAKTDLPKDVAAFANAEGGMLVYGVTDKNSAADQLLGVAEFDDNFERSIRTTVLNAISPPVLNVSIDHVTNEEGVCVVTVEVPRSPDAPHFIHGDQEGAYRAPMRVGRDTRWLSESEIAAAYRKRFTGQADARAALDELYGRTYDPGRTSGRAWLVAVARPVTPPWHQPRRDRDRTRELVLDATAKVRAHVHQRYSGALGQLDPNPRPALRGWTVAPYEQRRAWVSVYDDGSVAVSMAAADPGSAHEMDAETLESGIADLGALIRAVATEEGIDAYDVLAGVEYQTNAPQQLQVWGRDSSGYRWDTGTRIHKFTPVRATVDTRDDLATQVADVARDLVNQGGVSTIRVIDTDEPWM